MKQDSADYIEGTVVPVFTPMDDAGNVNVEVIPKYMAYLNDHKIPAILVGGTTGEAASLNLAERKVLLNAWLKAAQQFKVKVISQVGGAPMPDVIELAKYSKEHGADAIMTLPELYFKPRTVEQLVRYLQTVTNSAPDLPLIYYHFPMMSGVDVNIKQFFSLASLKIPTFIGIKADLAIADQVADEFRKNQRVYIANHHLAPSVLMGHHSSIATVSNMFPKQVREIVEAVKKGDVEIALTKQKEMNRLVAAIASHGDFVPAMKSAMKLISGIDVGPTRQPLDRLNNSQVLAIRDDLVSLNVI